MEENDGKLFPAYEAIQQAVNEVFREELKPGEEIIFSTKFEEDIIALKTEEGTVLPFQMLSDGYRNVIKIMLDIATRMYFESLFKRKSFERNAGNRSDR